LHRSILAKKGGVELFLFKGGRRRRRRSRYPTADCVCAIICTKKSPALLLFRSRAYRTNQGFVKETTIVKDLLQKSLSMASLLLSSPLIPLAAAAASLLLLLKE
jgi:hypothetical protein